jgi:pantetheine-phosphate adenylyltransferase
MRVLVGGTFDGLHEGHRALLRTAVEATGASRRLLHVGLTAGDMARRKWRQVRSWSERERAIRRFVRRVLSYMGPLEIEAIDATKGPSLSDRFDVLAVSEELAPAAMDINRARHWVGLPPLDIRTCPMVRDAHGLVISATRLNRAPQSPIRSARLSRASHSPIRSAL